MLPEAVTLQESLLYRRSAKTFFLLHNKTFAYCSQTLERYNLTAYSTNNELLKCFDKLMMLQYLIFILVEVKYWSVEHLLSSIIFFSF